MNIQEFYELLKRRVEGPPTGRRSHEECVVVVQCSDPSIGGHASSPVKTVGFGIDWDAGKFIIWTEDKLYKREQQEEIDRLRKELDALVWENMNLKRENKKKKEK